MKVGMVLLTMAASSVDYLYRPSPAGNDRWLSTIWNYANPYFCSWWDSIINHISNYWGLVISPILQEIIIPGRPLDMDRLTLTFITSGVVLLILTVSQISLLLHPSPAGGWDWHWTSTRRDASFVYFYTYIGRISTDYVRSSLLTWPILQEVLVCHIGHLIDMTVVLHTIITGLAMVSFAILTSSGRLLFRPSRPYMA